MRVLPLVVLLATGLPAQWRQLTPTVVPPAREGAAMVPGGRLLLFGGRSAQGPLNDLFLWTGADWFAVTTTSAPSPRANHRLAHDPNRDVALLFGGEPLSAETWELDLRRLFWTRLQPNNAPAPRHSHVLAFDANRQRFVLFGGFVGGFGLNDTWEFDGTNWTLMGTPTIPGPRGGCAAAFDPVHGEVVVFGGADALGGTLLGETWTYDGTDWTLRSLVGPAPRVDAAMTFDAARGRIVLFGGAPGGSETWEWDGATWTRLMISGPSGRSRAALAHHSGPDLNLMFGGTAGGAETWSLNLAQQPFFGTRGVGCGVFQPAVLSNVSGSEPVLGSTLRLQVTGLASNLTTFGILGLSGTFQGAIPLPRSLTFAGFPAGCMQYVSLDASFLLPPAGPSFANWNIPIPNRSFLGGVDFHVQTVQINTSSARFTGVSNAGMAIIGVPPTLSTLTETFASSAFRDPLASSGAWSGGTLQPGTLGGDGLHGSFDPAVGTRVAPGVFELDTDNTVIPANRTLSGVAETVTNGRYLFSDLVIPSGVTVRFKGSNPAILRVRGQVDVAGTLQANGKAMTGFQARHRFSTALLPGQPGGLGGPGGGRGGKGGDRCGGNGPAIVGGVNTNDGQPGEDVRLPAGHAFAGMQAGTGGQGSLLFPSSGLNSAVVYTVSFGAFSGMLAAGGGGGGYSGPGGAGMAVTTPAPNPTGILGPPSVGGGAFAVFPIPSGVSSLDHFAVGGSGGGGGGSHPFLAVILAFPDTWKAGAGGSGGGGALALRAGGDVTVAGSVEAKGGDGFLFSDQNMGIPAPGGGGSGGTVLVQTPGLVQVSGALDTSGGPGSSTGSISPPNINGVTQGGAGSPGVVRVESPSAPNLSGANLVPPAGANTVGPLLDTDARSGSRSLWYSPSGGSVPTYVRYELDAVINGIPVTFSDDPAVGMPANQPGGPIRIRFQGTAPDPMGNPDPAQATAWEDSVAALNGGRAAFLRFDIVFDRSAAMTVVADEVRVVFQ